jgi:hypothetical protein
MNKKTCRWQLKGLAATSSLHAQYCGKPATDSIDGKDLCADHAASTRRTKTRDENRRNAEQERAQLIAGWQERMTLAAEALGVQAWLDMVGFNYVERVVISLEDFERLAAQRKKVA